MWQHSLEKFLAEAEQTVAGVSVTAVLSRVYLSGIYTVIISKHLATLGRKKFLFKRKKQPEDPGSGRDSHLP